MLYQEEKETSQQDERSDETQQKKKAYVRKQIAYWSNRFDKSIKKARKVIFKTINDIGKERKNVNNP